MLITTKALIISKFKYGDNDLIVRAYTQTQGAMSFIVKGVYNNSKKSTKLAYFQPLSQLQLHIDFKSNRNLQYIKQVKPEYAYKTLHNNVYKGAIVIFLSEILNQVLKEEEANISLFSFLESTMVWLDIHTEYVNFHLLFLLKLTHYLGFSPYTKDDNYEWFNLIEGKFERAGTNYYSISGTDVTLLKQFTKMDFEALSHVKITAAQRHSFINTLIQYYQLHINSFTKPKSMEVFNQVFQKNV